MPSPTPPGNSTLPPDESIIGVQFKALKSHNDPRGFFREVVRSTDTFFTTIVNGKDVGAKTFPTPFAQWSHSKMTRDVVKAWHYHHVQFDWWYVPIGVTETVLFDNREESPTRGKKLVFKMGDDSNPASGVNMICVRIPPGVLHGCKVISPEAHLFYITSVTYDPNEEGRHPYDSAIVGHEWGVDAITAENDRKTFIPTSKRVPIL